MHLYPSDCGYFCRIWQRLNVLNEELMHFMYLVLHLKKDGCNSETFNFASYPSTNKTNKNCTKILMS